MYAEAEWLIEAHKGFTNDDPQKDTESLSKPVMLGSGVNRFTNDDPQKDTESSFRPGPCTHRRHVSPTTIRRRILKAGIYWRLEDVAVAGFTNDDPQKDTERMATWTSCRISSWRVSPTTIRRRILKAAHAGLTLPALIEFHQRRSAEGY